ncbi:MAG TPA: nuclear transport factor 2 family protein [Sphingomonas sp.]|jgi:hypothetical protein|uniref:nuclear transport factor 2 family protein n=1 Tax=Sphingomonas sp. TaxID=28214 RepID=UPI002EDB7372
MSDDIMMQRARQLDRLVAKDEIRDCLYRINRGMDRIDRGLMLSGFHDDAQICWAAPDYVPLATFIDIAMRVQAGNRRVQHLLGNILIELDGDSAGVESYEIGRHLTPMPGGEQDLIIAARYIDRFSRRDGVWRIERRLKLVDWIRVMTGADEKFDRVPHKGIRDRSDPSYALFDLMGGDVA